MRPIDADKLRADILDWENCYNGFSDAYDKARIIDAIDEQPTIKVELVRYGRGKYAVVNTYDDGTIYAPTYQCAACGGIFDSYVRLNMPVMPKDASFPKYCPNCGAKMEG